jgi:hypothetical protein
MKTKDLRIGNYLQFKKSLIDVYGLVDDKVYNHVLGHIFFINETKDIEPIPLTEDWLERFGFEYSDLNGDSGLWKIPPFQIYGKYNQFIYDYELDVNYVHQLQNLYFALTGEELKQNKEDANSTDNFNSNSVPSV